MSDVIVLAMFVLAPALVLSQLPVRARRYFLAAAIAALFAYTWLRNPGAAPGPLLLLPLALTGIVCAALLVEAVALVRRRLARDGKGAAHG